MDMSHGFGCKNSDNWMDEQVITPECPMLWLAGMSIDAVADAECGSALLPLRLAWILTALSFCDAAHNPSSYSYCYQILSSQLFNPNFLVQTF